MSNLDKMNDAELTALFNKSAAPAKPRVEDMSDDELTKYYQQSGLAAPPVPTPEPSWLDRGNAATRTFLSSMTAGLSEPVISGLDAASEVASKYLHGQQDGTGLVHQLKDAYSTDIAHRKAQQKYEKGSQLDTTANWLGVLTPSPISVVNELNQGGKAIVEGLPLIKSGLKLAGEAAPSALQKLGLAATKIGAGGATGYITGAASNAVDQSAQQLGGFSDHINPKEISDQANEYALGDAALHALGSAKGLVSGSAGVAKAVGEKVAPKATARVVDAAEQTAAKAKKAADVASGVKDSLKNAARALSKTVNPSIRAEYEKDVLTALENGVDPEHLSSAIKYGPDSFISKGDRVHAQGVAGEQQLLKHQEGLNAIRDATNRRISEFGGGEAPMDPTAAGEYIRNEHAKAVDHLFNDAEVTYDTVWKDHPGLQLSGNAVNEIGSKVEGVRRKAVAMAERGATDEIASQGKRLLFTTDRLNELLKTGSYKQAVEELRHLGDYAFKTNNGVLADNRKLYRDLYFSMQNGLLDTVESQAGKHVSDALKDQNAKFTQFFRNNEKIAPVIENTGKGGEQVFRELVQNGDSAKIRALKDILPPETHGKLKASYLENLKTEDKDGGFSFARLNSHLRNNDKARVVQQELFEKGEIDPFHRIAKLGEDHGQPILNFSGTDISNGFRKPIEALKEAALQESTLNTAKRMAEGTRPPMSPETMGQVIGHLVRTQGGGPIKVPTEIHADLRHLIRNSTGDSVVKAKLLDSLNRFGEIRDLNSLKSILFPGPK